MPKIANRRIDKANDLLARATRGPSISLIGIDHTTMTPDAVIKHFEYHYRLWSSSWVLPLINELVPELRVK